MSGKAPVPSNATISDVANHDGIGWAIATEISVAPAQPEKKALATEISVARSEAKPGPERPVEKEAPSKRARLRPNAARRAEQVAGAILAHAAGKNIPWYAVGIDQARIAEILGWDSSRFANRGKVWRAIQYAERIGLVSIIDRGRMRPDHDLQGVTGTYAVHSTDADEARLLSPEEIDGLKALALSEIQRSGRTRRRIDALNENLAAFDRQHGNRIERRMKNRRASEER